MRPAAAGNGAATATPHGQAKYLPRPRSRRRGLALCLSGGGFRAALFHLGGLRRLNELGLLSQVDTISSVSGGSIISAHLATRMRPWPAAGAVLSDPEWNERIATPFQAFVGRNLRTWPILNRLLPWNWLWDSTGVETLARQYEKRLTGLRLPELPDRPRFIFCATDLPFGVNWVFDAGLLQGKRGRMGDYQAGYRRPIPNWPLARAVAASSCFPPIFNPLPIGLRPDQLHPGAYRRADRDRLVAAIRLSDGGVYDNLGLEPVWKSHLIVLVSDGGAIFEAEADRGLLWRLQRYVTVVDSQARGLRKRWLIAGFLKNELLGAYWGIGSAGAHYVSALSQYPEDLVDEIISEVRTDLDAFSQGEIAVLENHGYLLADAAIQRHVRPLADGAAQTPLRVLERPAAVPHPEWMSEARVREALKDSGTQRLLGRW
ncbi:MAG TPA: patatin-like phospholipase family protein [bacterium]|nr:patatin-like phospholipase family protein [bacterium]